MPQIILKQPGQPVAHFAVSRASVSVSGVSIDLDERQQDHAVNIEIRQHNGVATEGGSAGAIVAQIQIPAREYQTRAADAAATDPLADPLADPATPGAGVPATVRHPLPLDPHAVVITLWPTA